MKGSSATEQVIQIVISQLASTASRKEFLELHRQTAEWLKAHPDCVSYELYAGDDGAIADRIIWSSRAGAQRGNEEYAATPIAQGMRRIIESYKSFLGTGVSFE